MTLDPTILTGDAWELAPTLPPESVDCIVTSPPYWGLRDYGHEGQFGLEATPDEYVERLVELFALLRPALKNEGTVWVNLGDSYAANGARGDTRGGFNARYFGRDIAPGKQADTVSVVPPATIAPGLKPKDLVGVPWRVALALQADGWYLRSDIIWSKPNPMPESVTDRPTRAHEYVFLLSKTARYFFDQEAVREALAPSTLTLAAGKMGWGASNPKHAAARATHGPAKRGEGRCGENETGRNIRTVWTFPAQPYPGAHFAVFPPSIPERCIKAGCPEGGTVLDPFAGSGTTLQVARKLGRRSIGFELNDEYVRLIRDRLRQGVLC